MDVAAPALAPFSTRSVVRSGARLICLGLLRAGFPAPMLTVVSAYLDAGLGLLGTRSCASAGGLGRRRPRDRCEVLPIIGLVWRSLRGGLALVGGKIVVVSAYTDRSTDELLAPRGHLFRAG